MEEEEIGNHHNEDSKETGNTDESKERNERKKLGYSEETKESKKNACEARNIDIMSRAAMDNAYYICHNVQVLDASDCVCFLFRFFIVLILLVL